MDKIVCLGRNYLEHTVEMGEPANEKPVLFLKPPVVLKKVEGTSLTIPFPKGKGEVHPECEIVLEMGKMKKEIRSVTLGLDMTLRDLQSHLKKAGHPWTIAKVFPNSAIIGPLVPVTQFNSWQTEPFSLEIDGRIRQKGKTTEMVLPPLEILDYIEQHFPLCAGDLIFTGTPAGVGTVVSQSRARLSWGKIQFEVQWV